MNHVTMKLKNDPDHEPSTVEVVEPDQCGHVDTMCDECRPQWLTDYEVCADNHEG